MSGAWVRLRAGERVADLYPGCTVGRSWRCDLVINDPRVSEVHAAVSLRGGALKLLPLGGNLWLYGIPADAVALRQGQRIALAEGLEVDVDDVLLPEALPALCIEGGEPEWLQAPRVWVDTAGVHGRPRPGCIEVWSIDEDWFAGTPPVPLGAEPRLVAGLHLQLTTMARDDAGAAPTRAGGLYVPLRIVARYDTVQIYQGGGPVLLISGIAARAVTELALLDAPVGWRVVASEVWPGVADQALRRRWDKALASLRGKLREAHVRPDLVKSSAGQVSLVLVEGDQLDVEV